MAAQVPIKMSSRETDSSTPAVHLRGLLCFMCTPLVKRIKPAYNIDNCFANWNLANSRSLRASVHTGVAIPRLDVPLLVDKFRKTVQKDGLYDDGLPIIRWRFPHQSADWFGMTRSDDAPIAMTGNSITRQIPNFPVCCFTAAKSRAFTLRFVIGARKDRKFGRIMAASRWRPGEKRGKSPEKKCKIFKNILSFSNPLWYN